MGYQKKKNNVFNTLLISLCQNQPYVLNDENNSLKSTEMQNRAQSCSLISVLHISVFMFILIKLSLCFCLLIFLMLLLLLLLLCVAVDDTF